jgi:hypothetical protein
MSAVAPPPLRSLLALTEEFKPILQRSVSNLEVAVRLESSGFSDDHVRRHYGFDTVFDLASQLRRLAHVHEQQTTEAGAAVAPTQSGGKPSPTASKSAAAARGAAYVAAGMIPMVAVSHLHQPLATPAVMGANVIATALMAVLSHLTYTAANLNTSRNRAAVARRPLAVGWIAAALSAAVTWFFAPGVLALAVALPLLYAPAAVSVLVLGRQRLFVSSLVPAGLVAIAALIAPSVNWLYPLAVTLGVSGVVALNLGALWVTRAPAQGVLVRPAWADFRAATDRVLASLLLAGVVVVNIGWLTVSPSLKGATARTWLILAAPFFVPLLFAEMLVVAHRSGIRSQLGTHHDLRSFGSKVTRRSSLLFGKHFILVAVGIVTAALFVRLDVDGRWLSVMGFAAASTLMLTCLLASTAARDLVTVKTLGPVVLLLGVTRLIPDVSSRPWAATAAIALLAATAVVLCVQTTLSARHLEAYR